MPAAQSDLVDKVLPIARIVVVLGAFASGSVTFALIVGFFSTLIDVSPPMLRIYLVVALSAFQTRWTQALSAQVPEPYLDEVFHIPQAQAYWAGRWSHWDDKITTPPGLYLWSYVFSKILWIRKSGSMTIISAKELRFVNICLSYVLMGTVYIWDRLAERPRTSNVLLRKELVVPAFPLLAFFSALYYTDLFSAWTIIATFTLWESGRRCSGKMKMVYQFGHVLLGLLSLATRQTNIFWVAVFLGGLQVVDIVKDGSKADFAWDPEVGKATVTDIFHFISHLIPAALTRVPSLLLALWPHLILLGSFALFIVWNGGVVLGDKSNHIATIHLPQLLYIWPSIVFFSWPALIPQLFRRPLHHLFPRPWLSILILLAMTAAVHFNTIIHPFTLADNRHYVFYVFRILTRYHWVKYAAVPIYFVSACLVLGALAGGSNTTTQGDDTARLSFVIIWFVATALSLISAPLVEPRYFIVPWLVWRIYLPDQTRYTSHETPGIRPTKKAQATSDPSSPLSKTINLLSGHALWLELAWYMAVNVVTCWVFLNWGFEWPQEPGEVQRFMW